MRKLPYFLVALGCATLIFMQCKTAISDTGVLEMPASTSYKLTPFAPSAQFMDAAINSFEYKGGKMLFSIGGGSYKLGEKTSDSDLKMCANSNQGQHIHVIVDNKPYDAKYQPEFDYTMEDGAHYILTFLSRSYHESIKTKAAHRFQQVETKAGNIVSSSEPKEPMLFYSRPKGNYIGKKETTKVMLDFFPVNCEIGKKYRVSANINGQIFILDKWQPYYIEGLPLGDNKIILTLIDAAGKPVKTPLNPVERTFSLKADPAEPK